MDIRQLLVYTDNCRSLLQETLMEHTEAFDKPFETIGEYRTVRELVAHCIGAEERWIEQRLQGRTVSPRYEDRSSETIPGLFSDWSAIRTRTREFLALVRSPNNSRQLHEEISLSLPQWGYSDTLTIEEAFFQVFNHQTYHLGQISMALQQLGIDPPNFDYIFLHREDCAL